MNERELEITLAVLEVMSAMGGTLISAANLERSVRIRTAPPATASEVRDRLDWCDGRGLITSVRGDTGVLYGLRPEGKAWLQTNG